MPIITDNLERKLRSASDLEEVLVKVGFTTSWAKEEFLSLLQRAGSPWVQTPVGRQFTTKYSSVLPLLGLTIEGKVRTGTSASFIQKIADTEIDWQDRTAEPNAAEASLYAPVIEALAEPTVVQNNQIRMIDEAEPIYVES